MQGTVSVSGPPWGKILRGIVIAFLLLAGLFVVLSDTNPAGNSGSGETAETLEELKDRLEAEAEALAPELEAGMTGDAATDLARDVFDPTPELVRAGQLGQIGSGLNWISPENAEAIRRAGQLLDDVADGVYDANSPGFEDAFRGAFGFPTGSLPAD